jgi:hypothetical protein
MRKPAENLAPLRYVVNPLVRHGMAEAAKTLCRFSRQNYRWPSRAPYFRRLHLLAAGSPRAMNCVDEWLHVIRLRSDFSEIDPASRKIAQHAWAELRRAARLAVEEIRAQVRASRG